MRIGIQCWNETRRVEIPNIIDHKSCTPQGRVLSFTQEANTIVWAYSNKIIAGNTSQCILKAFPFCRPKARGFVNHYPSWLLFDSFLILFKDLIDQGLRLILVEMRRTAMGFRIPEEVLSAQYQPIAIFVKRLSQAGT